MGELFAEFGDLVFTLVIGYISAIEFLYVVRHLYHYSFNHDADGYDTDGDNVSQLQDSMRRQLADAKNKEALAGTQVMKDGVPYKDGFRLEAQQTLIDQLKEQLKDKELSDLRRQELEKELAKQMKIAEQLRKELAEAEAKYERQLKQEAAEKAKKLLEEQQKREKEERAKKEAEEQARKLLEAEKQKEAEQRKREEEERMKKETEQKEKEKRQREEQERREAEEQARKLAEQEKQKEAEQRQREEAEESARKLAEAEKQREAEQRQREEEEERERVRLEAEENARKIQEAEKQREKEQRQREEQEEQEENERRLLAIEKANEEKQAAEEAEAAARKLLDIEHRLEEQLRAAEKEAELTEKERQLIESIKKRDLPQDEGNEQKEAELLRKILEAREQLGEESEEEQSLRLIQRERDQEAKQKRIEENALLFMEAEKEMAEIQAKMLDAVEKREFATTLDSAPQTPAIEEPCIKRTLSPLMDGESVHHTVKTQLAQKDMDEPYSVSSKTLLFPGVSDDASSIDPASSQQSSFSTQHSEEITTGTDSQYPQQERQEPDGEDTALTNLQYSDDYLRSLDGIKQRPLVREDGSGRRRAFKKRRSSNSSNSSRESRHSRDEELKMFTSLEEEEMKDTADSEFTPIRYTNEPTLKVKGHHRRHKRSPAKDAKHADDSLRSSLERLGEETSDPWGEVKPEHYKQTEFWRREKNVSIDEEMEFEKPTSSEDVAYDTATNMPSASSFEEATRMQNEEALTALQKHSASWTAREGESDDKATAKEETARSDNTNLIFSGEYTKAMDKDWHSGHFCCWQCDESLTGQRYVIRDDHPYCIKCYENVFANTCEECNKIIGIDSKDLSYKDKHWHEACFLCFKCHLSLVDKQFGAKADKIYCGNCYDAQFASRCDGCGEVFRAGTKKMEYKTRQWHENCFCCCVCKTAIGTKSFIPREQEIYCAGCYEEKFATRCIKCNKVITSGGVTYKNEPWHRECFTCTHCNITLAGQRFTSRDEKPYCADCFGELFAKRCTSCVKPITGIGGTRFISFEDRHWHHDCFVCASCKTSLVGRGFITDGPDIICPECAKQKLM
ncbi:trichohyalin isoform X2 [Calliphora vicina]|uniref:trichohyalin isoform X2 n=1 Tax=Calliphora vicina TaxID=7373 RepID=UPI00325B66E5